MLKLGGMSVSNGSRGSRIVGPMAGPSASSMAPGPCSATCFLISAIASCTSRRRCEASSTSLASGHKPIPNWLPWLSAAAVSRLRTVTGQIATSDRAGNSSRSASQCRSAAETTAIITSLPVTPAACCTARMRSRCRLTPATARRGPNLVLNRVCGALNGAATLLLTRLPTAVRNSVRTTLPVSSIPADAASAIPRSADSTRGGLRGPVAVAARSSFACGVVAA